MPYCWVLACEVSTQCKFHPRTGHKGPEEESLYSFFNFGTWLGWVGNVTPWLHYPQEWPIVQEAGWVWGLVSHPHWDYIPGPPNLQQVAVPTIPSWPMFNSAAQCFHFKLLQCPKRNIHKILESMNSFAYYLTASTQNIFKKWVLTSQSSEVSCHAFCLIFWKNVLPPSSESKWVKMAKWWVIDQEG
jgi:hypothetical protein